MKIPPERAIKLLSGRIEAIGTMIGSGNHPGYYEFLGWCPKTYSVIDDIYAGDGMHPEEIRSIGLPTCSCTTRQVTPMLLELYHSRLEDYIDEIERSIKKAVVTTQDR